jgi:hypothetical protein
MIPVIPPPLPLFPLSSMDNQNIPALAKEWKQLHTDALFSSELGLLGKKEKMIVCEIFNAFPAIASAYLAQEEKLRIAHDALVNANNVFCKCRYKEECHCLEEAQKFTEEALSSLHFPPS